MNNDGLKSRRGFEFIKTHIPICMITKSKLFSIAVLMIVSLSYFDAASQATLEWYKIDKGPWNYGFDSEQIAVDMDGNIFVTGTGVTGLFYEKTTNLDIVTSKYDASGNLIWQRSFLKSDHHQDIALALTLDKYGNIYVTGNFSDTVDNSYSFVALKYNSNGDLLWASKKKDAWMPEVYRKGILVDSSQNVYVFCADYNNSYLIKYNNNGDSLWTYTSNESNDASMFDNEGSILISGGSKVKKFSKDGVMIWNKTVPHIIYESSISKDKNGNYYICGRWSDTLYLFKVSQNGDLVWSKNFKKYQISSSYYFYNTQRCLVTKDGNVLLGFETPRNPGGSDIALMKFNPDGNLLWDRKYHVSDTSEQFLTELKEDARGFIYACGYSQRTGIPFNLDSNSIAILKYDPYGNLIRVTRKESLPTFLAIPKCFTIGGNDNMYIAIRNQSLTSYDYTILAKYSQPYDTLFIPVPMGYEISQNYPNPFNLTTNFKFQLPENTHVRLTVYDALGRRVAVLIDADMPADWHTYTWDASGFASGLYFYRFETPKYSVAKKMILVK